jgi:hypothetical protein
MLRLQFNLNETRYFVLIVFIEELLNTQYFLFFLLVLHEYIGRFSNA